MLRPQEVINGRYQIERLLGQGGMGKVYLADDSKVKQKVAIKVIHLDPGDSHLRFRREFRLMSRLEHPHIVRTVESGQHNNKPFLVMAYLSGGSLDQRYGGGAKDIKDTIKRISLIIQVCDALAYIHSQGIMHRDLKPENIMLEPNKNGGERVLLMDFGLAKRTSQETMALTQEGAVMGTIAYMSPEQAQGSNVDARSDLYALGCILYWVLIGEPPLIGNTFVETLLKKMRNFAEPPSLYKGFLPHTLDAIALKLLAKDPADRYSTATDIITDLRNVQAEIAKKLATDKGFVNEEELLLVEQKVVGEDVTLAQLFNAPLIGRDDIWQKLCYASQRLVQGQGNTFIIEGEMGMGISYLLTEFRREARSHGHRVLQLQHQQGTNAPYQAWKTALSKFKEQHRSVFRQAVKGLEPDLATLLPELEQDASYNFPADIIKLRLYNAVDKLLATLAEENSLVLLADNLHLADEAALGLLSYLARGVSSEKLLIVLALHPDRASANVLKSLKAIETEKLILSPLSAEAMQELITALLGGEVEQSLVSYVIERAAGNPFFAKEILTALLKDKHLRRRAGFWEWAREVTAIPASIEEILMQNLERLSEKAQKVVSVASAIGRAFDFELLQELLQADEDELLDDLDELLRAKVIEELDEENYRFSHLVLREMLHERMMLRRRHKYHQKIASILVERKNTPPEILADHYAETKTPEKAIPYALNAARAAEKVFANDITEKYYRLVIEVMSEDALEMPEIKLKLGKVLDRVGKWGEAEQLYKGLEQSEFYRSQAFHRLGCLAQKQGNLVASEDYLRKALLGSKVKLAVYSDLGRTLAHKSELDSAREVLQEALDLAMSIDADEAVKRWVVARAQIDLGTLEYHSGNREAAIDWLLAAKENLGADNKLLLAKVQNTMGLAYQDLGKLDVAKVCLEKAEKLYTDIGDAERALTALQNLGGNAILLEQETKALEIFAQVKKKAYRLGEDRLKAIATGNQGDLFLRQGRFQEAKEQLEEAYKTFKSLGFLHLEVHTRLNLSTCLARSGRLEESCEHLDVAEGILKHSPHPFYEAVWQLCFGELALRKKELHKAVKELEKASELLVKAQADTEDIVLVSLLKVEALLSLGDKGLCQENLAKVSQLIKSVSKSRLKLHAAYLKALCTNDEFKIEELQNDFRERNMDYLIDLIDNTLSSRTSDS